MEKRKYSLANEQQDERKKRSRSAKKGMFTYSLEKNEEKKMKRIPIMRVLNQTSENSKENH